MKKNENLPLVSVILPVFNAKDYIKEAIQSILDQSYENFELIIINDGSSDGTLDVILSFKSDKIKLISRENKGLVYSLNEGIKISQGKYIARMDADDISIHSRLSEQVKFMQEHENVGICGSFVERFEGEGSHYNEVVWKLPSEDADLRVRLLFGVPFAHPSIMMRKDIILKYNLYYNEIYKNAEDYKLWVDFSRYTKFANIQKVLLRYRYLQTSITRASDNKKDDERFLTISKIFNEVLENLEIKLSQKERKLHFILTLNERIQQSQIDLKVLSEYFTKIIKSNEKIRYFDNIALKNYLSLKFLVVAFFICKKKDVKFLNALFCKLFYRGIFVRLGIIK